MSFPRYPKYKASGVEWLGEVPEHWSRSALKRLADYENGFPYKPEDRGNSGRPIIRISQLTSDDPPACFEGSVEGHVPIEDGDLLFSWSASIDAFIWQRGPALLNQHIFKVTPSEGVYKRFLFHLIRHVAPKLADFDAHGSTMRHIKKESLGEVTYLPPIAEQRAIAAFLDRETKKIDELVAEQERLIELLKEKRQAVISHAVTKGLDPAAPMKPSGVEWLGDVPAHWGVKLIKRLSPVLRGASPRPIDDPKYFDDEGEFAWVRIADVSASDGELWSTPQRLSKLGSSLSVKLEQGSLFVSIAGTVGKPCITRIKACIHDGFVYFPRLTIEAAWLYRIFAAGLCYGGLGKLGTQLNLNTDTIGGIHVPLPPVSERHAIVAFLDRATEKIDTLVAQAESAIALLTERRSALISAAVTGQIDVRNAVASANPTEAA
jgi:type I restriction enzyme S subunit